MVDLRIKLLSDEIAKFYQIPCRHKKTLFAVDEYFEKDSCCLNFSKIAKLLLNIDQIACGTKDLQNYNYEDYLHFYYLLYPIYQRCSKLIPLETITNLHFAWLGNNSQYILNNLSTHIGSGCYIKYLELLLMLTSTLEYALGNLYFTITKLRPPHLLRDLLNTEELVETLGIEAIIFLKILLGTPKSINLRNIIWHGFPKPDDIPKYYIDVLIITIHTLGSTISAKNVKLEQRIQIINFTEHLNKFNVCCNIADTKFQMSLLKDCFLDGEYKKYWAQIFDYYKNKYYCEMSILILPQIELILRLIYGKANKINICAKLSEYYITIDTIFQDDVPIAQEENGNCMKQNQLLLYNTTVSVGALKCLYDLFLAPEGLRLRDKLSHGEVLFDAIQNAKLCKILLYLAMNLLTANELEFPLANYESKYHLNCITKESIKEAKLNLINFVHSYIDAQKFKFDFNKEDCSLDINKIEIFRRHKREAEFMQFLKKIAQLITSICCNYRESVQTRQALLNQHELHSKRRRTLERVLNTMPSVFMTLYKVLTGLIIIFSKLQSTMDDILENAKSVNKLLRYNCNV